MCSAVRRRMLSKGTISSPPGRGAAGAAGAGSRGRGLLRASGPGRGQGVVAGDAPPFPGAGDRRRVEAVLVEQPAHHRRDDDARGQRATGRGRGRAARVPRARARVPRARARVPRARARVPRARARVPAARGLGCRGLGLARRFVAGLHRGLGLAVTGLGSGAADHREADPDVDRLPLGHEDLA